MLTTHNSSFPSIHQNSTLISLTCKMLYNIMTANLLTLNSSKTEFLLIGLKQQLSKIHDSSLTTTHSVRNVGIIFDEHLTFSDQISALSKSCELHCIRPYLDFKTLTPPLSILNSITVTITIFQTITLTGSNRSRTLLLVLLVRLLNPHIGLYHSHSPIFPLA